MNKLRELTKQINNLTLEDLLESLIADSDIFEVVATLDMIVKKDKQWIELHCPEGKVYPCGE